MCMLKYIGKYWGKVSFKSTNNLQDFVTGRGPILEPESGLLCNTWNELSKETHMLTKQETLPGRGTLGESRRVREPRRSALPVLSGWGFMVMGLVSSCLWRIILTQGALLSQEGFQQGGLWEVGRICSVSFWLFLNSSDWWWLVPCQDLLS